MDGITFCRRLDSSALGALSVQFWVSWKYLERAHYMDYIYPGCHGICNEVRYVKYTSPNEGDKILKIPNEQTEPTDSTAIYIV